MDVSRASQYYSATSIVLYACEMSTTSSSGEASFYLQKLKQLTENIKHLFNSEFFVHYFFPNLFNGKVMSIKERQFGSEKVETIQFSSCCYYMHAN
jgi:hypothetical protein